MRDEVNFKSMNKITLTGAFAWVFYGAILLWFLNGIFKFILFLMLINP